MSQKKHTINTVSFPLLVYFIPNLHNYGSSMGNWCYLYCGCLCLCFTLSSHQVSRAEEHVPRRMGFFRYELSSGLSLELGLALGVCLSWLLPTYIQQRETDIKLNLAITLLNECIYNSAF